ncbi:hypothetical protein [Halobacillus naozhouensis]|uniref:Zinc ribbon domain-containing protein n=1 Tax=Halobacillus naozhouensis TaxID=554880 RepID=A0ABY8IVY5_9BACI|nr:hypothetical protein [Halobacillus naozhouensis]WFT73876.1 hypothetical protein P9989_16085 [Halobacillus naozhouensis]
MICSNCSHEQESGNFCRVCGVKISEESVPQPEGSSRLQEQQQAHAAVTVVQPQTDNMAKAKQLSAQFGRNALQMLKRPSTAFNLTERQFVSSLVTMAIYILAFMLSLYFLVNKLYKVTIGGFGSFMGEVNIQQSLPFFKVAAPIFLFVFLFITAATVTVFLVLKMMNINLSFPEVVAQYGGLMVPFTALNVIAILFGLSGSIGFTLVSLNISLVFTVFILPAIAVYHHGLSSQFETRNVYWSIGTSAVTMLLTYFIVQAFVLDFMERLQGLASFL